MFANPLLLPALLAILFASLARAASLSDFTPRVSGLSGKCLLTYHKPISGCSGSDFQPDGNCSAKCIDGLVDLASLVTEDCSDAHVDANSLIGIFLAGQGPSTLCSNAVSGASSLSTAAPTTTTSIVVRSSTLDLTTTPAAATSIQVDTSLPSTTTLSLVMSTSQSTTATASTTADATEPGTTLTSTTPAPAPTETTTSNGNGNGNGGGDPFNLFNTSPPNAVLSTWLLMTSLAACAFLAHISL